MGYTLILLALAITAVIGLTPNETLNEPAKETQLFENSTSRKGRHLHVEVIELPSRKTKRQIIKIPGNVSKVKLVRPVLNMNLNGPYFARRKPHFYENRRRVNNKKQPEEYEYEYEVENPEAFDAKKVNTNSKKVKVKETSSDFDDEMKQAISFRSKLKKQNLPGDHLPNYEIQFKQERLKEGGYDTLNNRYRNSEQTFHGYDSAESNIRMKQVPPPNLFGININSPEMAKNSYPLDTLENENHVPGMTIKKLPTKGRQIQSIFSQQYTTHNPHVTTNFGLGDLNGYKYFHKGSYVDATPMNFPLGKFNQPMTAASNQIVKTVPVIAPGIQVIQPPQFKDAAVTHPFNLSRLMSSSSQQQPEETSSQKATIRDILEQDCPSYDIKGFCESPPRYPMQQISNIVKKCASLMDAMNTQPFDEPQEVFSFAKRSDQYNEAEYHSNSTDAKSENIFSWARSSNEETTACSSELNIAEPGYAKEVLSGRWFVIVQHPDTTIQRIATDTCRSPGKPCAGLVGLKCSKGKGLHNKSTMCVQRFTYQRLVSWDPESPEKCPRIRLFRFPSACICHLGII